MIDVHIPVLDEVDLPPARCWVAFRAERRLYVLRADSDDAWTVLDECGRTRGTIRRAGKGYRAWNDQALGRAENDWRDVVRKLF